MASRVKKSPLSIMGVTIILFFAAVALLAGVLAPPVSHDPFIIPRDGFSLTPKPPNEIHPFGTAQGQWDIYYGCIWGTITAFRIGFMVVVGSLIIGLALGLISGYYGGIVDELMMRFTDIIIAFPTLILAMALVISLPQNFVLLDAGPLRLAFKLNQLDKVLLALTIVGWPTYTRVLRGEVLRIREEDYIEAAKAVGCSDLRVMVRHVLPNAIYPILIIASLDIGSIVLTAATLSFFGIGAPVGYADWGQMISFSRNWIYAGAENPMQYWFTWVIPGIFIFTFSLGWNLLGDAFRDILDPTLRRR